MLTLLLQPHPVYADTSTLAPNAAGDRIELTASPSGSNYVRVQTNDGDTSYVRSLNSNTYSVDLYNIADVSLSGTINSVNVTMVVRATATGQTSAYTVIKTGGTEYNGTAQTVTTSYAAYTTTYNTNPNTGSAWTWAQVNSLQAGVALRRTSGGQYTRCTQVYVTLNYTPPVVPTVATGNATLVEETTATLNGNITASGGAVIDIRGFQWDIDSGAPYTNNWTESGSFGTGAYFRGLTSLNRGTLYYFRALAHNSAGWGYGAELKFLTKPDEPNTLVATPGNQQVQLTWVKGGGAQITIIRGRIGGYPTSYNTDVAVYSGNGTSATHSGLNNGDHWYYRAWSYTVNGGLEQCSDLYVQADAIPVGSASLTTDNATLVEETSAVLNGTLINDGGEACQYSFEWGTISGVYTDNISWTGSISTGQTFNTNLAGLTKGQSYYYRAKVRNSTGVVYGGEVHFLTKPDAPVAGSFVAVIVSSTRIDLSWIKGEGALRTMVRAKEGDYPFNVNDGRLVYFDTGTSVSDLGLSANTTYYYRAWSEVTDSQQWSNSYVQTSATTSTAPILVTVGGTVYSVDKMQIMLPWIGMAGIILVIVSVSILFIAELRRNKSS